MKTLPVDVLKIDKAFVDGLPDDSSMVQAIIQMARSLNLHLIAEGIETDAQRARLAEAGVESGQGFLFAPQCLRMSLKNDTFLVLTITQKCNFVAGLCEPAQIS